ncbi:aminoacyl-tRNA hydrolase [Paenalkalicoccus suaedae]|uniref:Peptidyl-tRNA hydrolase n=1 Tax=Paenalkalicoccus suaedae TaxID=2592382 RepID=A0A859FK02_9BACI|nr:aminoacyl-tRNA hydrolase [Paenalkalicoccus suaedae]QKS73119.1 aminoacyl-tRNA hydrolase [Paenalkalicoccus suaedae]
MKLIVGLGNPGRQYERTRHNIGFDVLEMAQDRFGVSLNEQKFKGVFGVERVGMTKIFYLKPLTYMNLSGESVVPLMNYYDITPDNLVVVYDDLDLPPGKIRLRQKGSHGGHNGIRSLIKHLGTEEFNRIRIGIGRPDPGIAVPDYVLGKFKPDESAAIEDASKKAVDALEAWKHEEFLKVMNSFN